VETHPKENRRRFIQAMTFGSALFTTRRLFAETFTQTTSLTEELTGKFDIVMGR
jgi:hypothetical protein